MKFASPRRFAFWLGPTLGLAFRVSTAAAPYQVLHSFDPPPPISPQCSLVSDAAGNLFGTTSQGGLYGYGTVFELEAARGYAIRVIHAFAGPDGAGPSTGLIVDESGFLYGTTFGGGASSAGTVFRLDPAAGYALTTLHDFAPSEGSAPTGRLLKDASGNLYGVTLGGGAMNKGAVFRLDAASGYTLTRLHSFTGADGAKPYGALLADATGNLYGTTSEGGSGENYGTVFMLNASAGYALSTLHTFDGTDGWSPRAGLTADDGGNLYGTTISGLGQSSYGTVFRIGAGVGHFFSTIHHFQGFDGSAPGSELIVDASGSLYGTTGSGGEFGYGTVFRISASPVFALTTLHSFDDEDGAHPGAASLLLDSSGNLYGTTPDSGIGGGIPGYYGTAFRLDASAGYSLTTLARFGITDGANPLGALIADATGNLYGTTHDGGGNGFGSVFRLDGETFELTTLHSFASLDGQMPGAGLLADALGNLIGTTLGGGPNLNSQDGTVFRLDAGNGYALTALHDFTFGDGQSPLGSVVADPSGNLFGTTNSGGTGTFASGTVFELIASSDFGWAPLHEFSYSDGAYPSGALLRDASGNLYGTTGGGGAFQYFGTVFKLDASNAFAFSTLHDFSDVDGSRPTGSLIADPSGNLFGTTNGNGAVDVYGTVFELDASNGYALTPLHTFQLTDGGWPGAGLVADGSGNLYGTTIGGGAGGKGTVFRLDASKGWALTTLHEFAGPDGAAPEAPLYLDAAGNVYGTTTTGGAGGTGVVFRIGPPIPLTLLGVVPASGSAAGYVSVLIEGTGFAPNSGASIGGVNALTASVIDQGRIGASTPVLIPGSLNDVTVANPDDATSVTLPAAWFADFLDVPQNNMFHGDVEKIFRAGVAAGCGGGTYCPASPVTRAQMAVFLLKAEHGSAYAPPACHGVFADVPCPGPFSDWIEQLATEGITAGCGGGYCPAAAVTRQQMAVFLLKTEHGPAYAPPACIGGFGDVPCPGPFTDWVEQLHAEGVTGGCQVSPPLYCPTSPVNRGQMATFLVKAFHMA